MPEGAPPLSADLAGVPIAFARIVGSPAELSVPDHTRPVADVPADMPLMGPFEAIRTVEGVTHWEHALPIRSRALFFSNPAPKMTVSEGKRRLTYERSLSTSKPDTWRYDEKRVIVRTDDGEPEPGRFILRFPTASERERGLHWDTWHADNPDGDELAFIQRSLQFGRDTRTGLLLPTPTTAGWSVELPPNATLQLDGIVLPPEAFDGVHRSDGAELIVEVVLGNAVHEVLRTELEVGAWKPLTADLSDHSGRIATLRFRTESDNSDLDYVFLAEPTVFTPKEDPERVVLVFLDTLRADHLGTYGYERDTSPRLDAWAEDAVVFEQARSVAPWTLPSTRSALSGRQPEYWPEEFGPILPEVLAENGWATGAYVGNVYLSSNFDMSRGWSEHGCVNWPVIDDQIDEARDFIERHPTRDVAILLHTMDMHLPYTEPSSYKDRWSGEPPPPLSADSQRKSILSAAKKDREAVKTYIVGRYDQNIAYTDDALMDFLEWVDADTVVIFADHGEEFWDHDDFEHGHTLYDELLHIPLIVKDEQLPAGRVSEPVSIRDITPTLLDLLDIPIDRGVTGSSLVPAASGDEAAKAALKARPHSVGRPLYGRERWGVIAQELKWTTYRGDEEVYDLAKDPTESDDLRAKVPLDPLRSAFAEGLAQEAPLAWRVDAGKASVKAPTTVSFHHPSGFREAWLGQDPLKSSKMTIVLEDGVAHVTFHPGKSGTREIYLVPTEPGLAGFRITHQDEEYRAKEDLAVPVDLGDGKAFVSTRLAKRSFKVGYAVAPIPADGMQLVGVDAELEAELAAMGYTTREDEE